MTRLLIAVAAVLASAIVVAQQGPPARDQQQQVKGSGVIKGQVLDASTGGPVRRVSVVVNGNEPGARASTLTDADGRFELAQLRPGRYTISVNKSGYVPTMLGQRRLNGPGTPVELGDGQTVEKLIVRIARGGIIVGRVFDEFGEPAAGAEVRAHQYRYQNGQRRLSAAYGAAGNVRTDDLGAFRLYGLQPGQYYVSARVGPPVRGFNGEPPEKAAAITTYFPNTADSGAAQRVTVASARETAAVNISLLTGALARIRGRAVMSTGEPFAGSSVTFSTRDDNSSYSSSGGVVRADGSFDISGVAAGNYVISVRPQNSRDGDDVEIARAPLIVNGEDVDDVVLVGGRGAIVRGRVVSDDGSPLPMRPQELTIQTMPGDGEAGSYVPPAAVQEDYSFELRGLFGKRRLMANYSAAPAGLAPPANPAPWSAKTVRWRGEDLGERPFDFSTGQVVDGIEVVFSKTWAELTGTVADDRGIVSDVWLVLFPADEARWTSEPRLIRALRPNSLGVYRFQRLFGHGDYLLATVPDMEPGQWQDPDVLKTLVDRAIRVSLNDGESKVQNVRIGSAP
ncbi:MAG TPA: carboxypeptidase-like regulatory domain-containing protein [Vicinamibacterales bacterium]|nr:carboxypeptidase-like regulatory domain-containing protein [Vicinamibacterales bacterium]